MKKESNIDPPEDATKPPPRRIQNAFGCPKEGPHKHYQQLSLMTKQDAVLWYKEITGGAGVDRYECLETISRGRIAEKNWDDGLFTLGIEYGVLIALVKVFNITREDII